MKTLQEAIRENLAEDKPYHVRISGKGKRAGQMRVTMSSDEVERHRSPSILKDREPKVGDHIRRPYDWNTVSVITHVEKKPGGPDSRGNTHNITHQALGRIWAKNSKTNANAYQPPKVATKPKKVSVGLHPRHGWHSNPGLYVSGKREGDPHGYEHFVVKPKEASFTDFYQK